ncbi:aspartic peptidase domain-containing protein [Gigaspora rosea]|uniref:Aspartic peptidase domain-containing protein n=1 Tax=Gigaspora rosea TaxID=44941 RepID=A0A397VUI8_9GLOM|nr:aspartic peptidase domain-containing protein [Gigaspora rosea]CAG8450086.1 25967_t:CDS:2 [Gigaspora rosea]
MKLVFLFIILSVVTIHNICAYPNPNNNQFNTINLVKRVNVNNNALDYVKRLRQGALNRYSESNLQRLSSISNAETSNDKTSSDTPAPNDISGDSQASSSDTPTPTVNTMFIKSERQDESYYGKIIVGNQEFNVILDTGSSDLWVPNINCTSASCHNHNKFDPSKSTSFKPEGKPWNITYGSGSAAGFTGIENIQIGNITATGQIFEDEADGILGLAFDELNTLDNGAPTLISTLIKQKNIDPIFSFHFSHFTDFDDQGTFILGGVDESKYKGNITFTPVISPKSKSIPNGFWVIKLGDAKISGESLNISRDAIIDTGTTVILVPIGDADTIHKKIPGSKLDELDGVYVIPCNTTAVVSLKFEGVDYDISVRDLLVLPADDTMCFSGIFPASDSDIDFWLVGQTFLKGVYSAFDVGNKKVGFALSK